LAEAFERLETTDARWCEPELHRVRAGIAVAPSPRGKGRAQATREAERCLRGAIEVAATQGARWWELAARLDLAKLTADEDAVTELRQLHAVVDDGSDAAMLRDVRAFLGV
jgi:hypothetical protein